MGHLVRLYSRPACGLCDEAREVIEAVRATVPFDLDEVDVETDDDLEREYGIRIPVVEVDGVEAFEIEVDPEGLRALVAR